MTSSPIPISKTKIIVPPRREELLSRSRLLDGLRASLDNKLILLAAAAGYGKTSLLIDFARTVEMPVSWLSLDQLDRDPQRFMAYLIASLSERFPGVGESSQNLLNNLKTIESDAESLLVTLTNELYDQVEEDYLLILDDYHLLDDVPVISSLVNRFLQLVDENCHVIIASRTLPDLDDVTLMVAREQVAGLSQTDLAFQPREIQALYLQNHHRHLSDEKARQLHDETGGWITGMVLSNASGMQVSGVDMFSYLGSQVLNQQPPHLREFLLRTSLPEEFNAEYCEIVLGPFHPKTENWLVLMGLILEKNLFVLPLDEDGRWLRYHPLFRDFLQSRLKRERPHEIEPMLVRMVRAYEGAGEWEKAYFACKQLNDLDALAGVIERAGTPMLQTALVTLEGWINSLPPAVIRSRPGLISLRGAISRMKGNLSEAIALLDMAVDAYTRDGDVEGLVLALVRRANTLRLLGKYSESIRDADGALQMAESNVSFQPLYAEALRIRGLNSYRLGESRTTLEYLERSLSLYTELNETESISMLLAETAMVRAAIGDVEEAKTLYQESLKRLQQEKNLYTQADTLNNLAVLYLQLGEYEFASSTFEEGLRCARKSRNHRAEALILAGLGDLYGEIEEFGASAQAYELADAAAGEVSGHFISNYLVLARAGLALARNDLDSASSYLSQFRKKLKLNPSGYERGLWDLLEGRRHFLKNDLKKAITYLKDAKTSFFQDGRESEYQWCLIWLIAAYDCANQREEAQAEFTGLMAGQAKTNHTLILGIHQASPWLINLHMDPEIGKSLGVLLEKARQLGLDMPRVRRDLRRFAQSIQLPTATLKIQGFGRPEVSVNGKVLHITDWRVQSARDLFFFFLNRQEPMTREQIGPALWREAEEPSAARTRFKQDIYRLRRAVGRHVILFEDETYRFNRELDYEYDVEAFESYLYRARSVKDVVERIGYYRKAVDLVQGPYLEDVYAPWVTDERERLKMAYMYALENLARLYLDTNQLQECLEICNRLLNQDRYNETVCQVEMRAYAAQGDRAAVARRYREYKAILAEDLGLTPSEETDLIYRDLSI
jgi:ATP/maltotriose-dependent transcriptional regulator MalT/DNA-binding SARP family transcriptional activator